MIRAEAVKFRGLLRPSGRTSIQGLHLLFLEPALVQTQYGSDSFGPHVSLGTQLVEAQQRVLIFTTYP